jgi:hypothetical protein
VGYTAHAVLEGLARAGQAPGALDASVALLLPILDSELFGEVAEAKEYSNFAAAYKEAKKCRAFESYQLLAAGVTFGDSISHVLGLVRTRLHEAGNPKVRCASVCGVVWREGRGGRGARRGQGAAQLDLPLTGLDLARSAWQHRALRRLQLPAP